MKNFKNHRNSDNAATSIAKELKLSPKQTTLSRAIDCVGVGLHSGEKVSLKLCPASAGSGVIFRRTDLEGIPEIKASWENVVDTRMCTKLGDKDGVVVSTVEHLMAALSGSHVDNVIVELDGPEVPIMDGSSQPFIFLIECAGVEELDVPRQIIEILKPVRVENGSRVAELLPSKSFSIGFEIDFDDGAVTKTSMT